MPTYQRFEDLPVWQEAIVLAERVEDFLEAARDRLSWSKRDQLDRASLSVSNNIAEGFERGTTNELLSFLYIARGSAGEVRSMLCYFERRPKLRDLKSQISNLRFQHRVPQTLQNTLYLLTPRLSVRRDDLALSIEHDGALKLVLPVHNLESVFVFGSEI